MIQSNPRLRSGEQTGLGSKVSVSPIASASPPKEARRVHNSACYCKMKVAFGSSA